MLPPLNIPAEVPTLEPDAYQAWVNGVQLRDILAERQRIAILIDAETIAKLDQKHQSVIFALDGLPFCETNEDFSTLLGFVESTGLSFDGADVLASDPAKVVQDNPSHPLNRLGDNKAVRARAMLLFACFSKDNGFDYAQEEVIIARAGGETGVTRTIENMRFTLFANRSLLSALSIKEWATNKRKMKPRDFYASEKSQNDSERASLRSFNANHLGYFAMKAKRKARSN